MALKRTTDFFNKKGKKQAKMIEYCIPNAISVSETEDEVICVVLLVCISCLRQEVVKPPEFSFK